MSGNLKLIQDNSTRWCSTLLMVESIVKLQAPVETIIVVQKLVKQDNLSQGGWLVLQITVRMQAEKDSTIHEVVPYLRETLAHLEKMKLLGLELELEAHGVHLSASWVTWRSQQC
ncbi:hypothetical protein RvY_11687-3 [Ramazzottius varieornatus]|uniref:Uncharacterized protein n=1 Tax=Ramazzottius varieornatus TaxID=947166 RepID=A0A1D1VGZ9_RAMVA|nr:hypothetical protein RvY_11687-3 [Ramazzottius varieornatus]